jgi:hypothetical protein
LMKPATNAARATMTEIITPPRFPVLRRALAVPRFA